MKHYGCGQIKEYDKSILLTCSFDSAEQATHIARSLEPEIKKDTSQVNIHLFRKDAMLEVRISAANTSMLRAAVNSYLRWINTAYSVHRI